MRLTLSQDVLDFVKDDGFFETVHGGTFHIRQAYLHSRQVVGVDCSSDDSVEWLPHSR